MGKISKVGRVGACAVAWSIVAGCGYVDGPRPPLINIPSRVSNLAAVQRGNTLIVQFTVPTTTTENEPLKPPLTLDLRIGDKHQSAPPIQDGIARYEIPCTEWIGKDAAIEVHVVGGNGKTSAPSALTVPIIAPPDMPHDVKAEAAVNGVRLTWASTGAHFHILRKGSEKGGAFALLAADVTQHEFVDASAEFGKPYSYLVQSFAPIAAGRETQSDLPEATSITPVPPLPAAPANLRAISGTASIEISWDVPAGTVPSGYRVFRATGDGDFVKLADSGVVPVYSDRTAEAGKTYRYVVAALDANGRESPRSQAIEATL